MLHWEESGQQLRSLLGGSETLPVSPPTVLGGRDPPSMTTCHVHGAVLAAHHKIVDVSVRERHGGDSDSFGLLEHQLHTVLWKEEESSVNNKLPGQALGLDTLCQTQPIKVT